MSFLRHRSRRFYLWGAGTLVFAMVIAIVGVVSVRANQEAKKHDPHGAAATAARWNIEPVLAAALDDVASQLSFGTSLGAAVQDTCRALHPTSMDFSVTCDRRVYRSYAITNGVSAHSLASRLGQPWQPIDSFCDADLTPDAVCLQTNQVHVELMTEQATKNPQSIGLLESLLLAPQATSTVVELAGFDALTVVHAVVIVATATYYVG